MSEPTVEDAERLRKALSWAGVAAPALDAENGSEGR